MTGTSSPDWQASHNLDAVVVDIGGTIVKEQSPGTAVHSLTPVLLANVERDLEFLTQFARVGAATNTAVMSESDVRSLLAKAHIDRYFTAVVTSFDVGAAKPDPTMLVVAMNRLGISDPAKVLFIGDRSTDEEAARRARMHFAYIEPEGLAKTVENWTSSHQPKASEDRS